MRCDESRCLRDLKGKLPPRAVQPQLGRSFGGMQQAHLPEKQVMGMGMVMVMIRVRVRSRKGKGKGKGWDKSFGSGLGYQPHPPPNHL